MAVCHCGNSQNCVISGERGESGYSGGPGLKGYPGDPGYYGNKGAKGFRGSVFTLKVEVSLYWRQIEFLPHLFLTSSQDLLVERVSQESQYHCHQEKLVDSLVIWAILVAMEVLGAWERPAPLECLDDMVRTEKLSFTVYLNVLYF